jgi:hypothetical protein
MTFTVWLAPLAQGFISRKSSAADRGPLAGQSVKMPVPDSER